MCGRHTRPADSPWERHVSVRAAAAGRWGPTDSVDRSERRSAPTARKEPADKGVPMRLRPRTTTLLVSLGTAAALSLQVAPAAAYPGHSGGDPAPRPCTAADTVPVPGAEHAETACLDDITTAGLLAAGARAATPTRRTGRHPARARHDQPDRRPRACRSTATSRTRRPSTPPTAGTTTASSCCASRTTGTAAWWWPGRRATASSTLRLPDLRLRARPGLRLRLHRQGQQQPGLLPRRAASPGTPSPSGTSA